MVLIFCIGSGLDPIGSPDKKEAEIDALTDLLVQNMEAAGDPDFYGEDIF